MKILIGYDGSKWADIALEELSCAGLPREAEAVVLSAAEPAVTLPMSCYSHMEPHAISALPPTLRHAHLLAADAMANARTQASEAQQWLRERFPHWTIDTDVTPSPPQEALVARAKQWQADLIVVGSHGRSALVRLFTGSVAQDVVRNAPCSVRVSRRHEGMCSLPRLVIGLDTSAGSERMLRAVVNRKWPQECEARIVTALDDRLAAILAGTADQNAALEAAQRAAGRAADELKAAGIKSEPILRLGDPKQILVEEANHWNADCIFVGAKGIDATEPGPIGKVACGVVSHARCTVEVVRG